MPFVKVGPRHQITIPQAVRKMAGIDAGDLLEVVQEQGRVVLIPTQVTAKPAVPNLTGPEQELLLSARQKIAMIQRDMPHSVGLTQPEADVAAAIGLIEPDQRWWWTERWQEGERRAEADIRGGRVEAFDSPGGFLKTLKTL